jgi:hypothetical protein
VSCSCWPFSLPQKVMAFYTSPLHPAFLLFTLPVCSRVLLLGIAPAGSVLYSTFSFVKQLRSKEAMTSVCKNHSWAPCDTPMKLLNMV